MRHSSNPFDPIISFVFRHKMIGKLLALVFLGASLWGCWLLGNFNNHQEAAVLTSFPESEEELRAEYPYLSLTALDTDTDMTEAKELNLSEYEEQVVISEGGKYHVTGQLNGSLYISVSEENVHLFFDNVEIISSEGPAILCENADKLTITLVSDSVNQVSDSGGYLVDDECEACIFSVCDMTLNGTGSLIVNGLYKDAIRSKDIIKILDGDYEIKCKRTGIHGNDGILIEGGTFTISSEKNGLKTSKIGSDGRGNIIIAGGNLSIVAGRYAFVALKAGVVIYNCTIYNQSIVDAFDVSGRRLVQEGCLQ